MKNDNTGNRVTLDKPMDYAAPPIGSRYESAEGSVSFLDILIAISRRKTLIFRSALITGVIAVVVSLLIPNEFTATTRILPPQKSQSTLSSFLGQLGPLAALSGAGDLGLKDPNGFYVGMLKSRTLSDALIKRFALQNVYHARTMAGTRDALASASTISNTNTGLITIDVTDRDPKLAADLANAYVEELRVLTKKLALSDAAQRRVFYEDELNSAREQLSQAELNLKKTQENTGVLQLESQARSLLESAARMRAEVTAREVALRGLQQSATEDNPDVRRLHAEIQELRSKLAALESSSDRSAGIVAQSKLPESALAYFRALRELKYREGVYELLAKQFEAARIDSANSVQLVQVLDPAVPPDRKSRPSRSLLVLFSVFLVTILISVAIAVKEIALSEAEDLAKVAELREQLFPNRALLWWSKR